VKLRPKIVLALALVIAPYSVGVWALQHRAIVPGFVAMEERQARRHVERARGAIEAELMRLEHQCEDWAAHAETREALEGHAPRLAANGVFGTGPFGVTLVERLDARLHPVWSECRIPGDAGERDDLDGIPSGDWPKDHPLLAAPGGGRAGVVPTALGPLLVASRPIAASAGAPPSGWIVIGRLVDRGLEARLAQQTMVDFDLLAFDRRLDPATRELASELGSTSDVLLRPHDESCMEAWGRIDGLDHRPAALIRVRAPRDITASGAEALQIAAVTGLAAALVLGVALWLVLVRTIVRPLQQLTAHAIALGQRDDLGQRLALRRDDEIGALSVELDLMIEKLSRSRSQLLETARVGGMSEVATRVLHDVGNALNSVNVSTGVISEKASSTLLGDLDRAVTLITDHRDDLGRYLTDDERGRKIPAFLRAVVDELERERTSLQGEARSLKESIDHMQALVSAQQDLARRDPGLETVVLRDVVQTAWRIASAKSGGAPTRFTTSFDGCPPLVVDRHKLLQILVNLLRNAREAQEGRAEPCEVRVRARIHGADRIRIEVEDDGCGIAPEQLSRIFEHGFTTKRKGHGFGLHTAALAASELGGQLSARSAGRDAGACFLLELPVRKSAAAEAAQPAK
jgi:signal transduction histidine kinase